MKNNVAKAMLPMLLMLAMATVGRGQWSHAYYHRVGDTVEQTIPIYYYQWWDWDRYITTQEFVILDTCYFADCPAVMSYFQTPTPIRVIGISGMVFNFQHAPQQQWWLDIADSLLLYDAGPNGPVRITSVAWRDTDDHRYLHITSNGKKRGLPRCCTNAPWDKTNQVFEYYFDTSYLLTDSFYVGCTQMYGHSVMVARASEAGYNCAGEGPRPASCAFPYNRTVVRQLRFVDIIDSNGVEHTYAEPYGGWRTSWPYMGDEPLWDNNSQMLMVFPIIEVDTTVPPQGYCQPPENVQVPLTESGTATVTWDGFVNYTNIEVQYGRSDIPVRDRKSVV